MAAETVTLAGRRYAIVPLADYERLLKGSRPVQEADLPPMPRQLSDGNYPAMETMRVLFARDIISQRKEAGLSQAELARRAGIRPETLNRIEKARVMPDSSTADRIMAALRGGNKRAGKRATG